MNLLVVANGRRPKSNLPCYFRNGQWGHGGILGQSLRDGHVQVHMGRTGEPTPKESPGHFARARWPSPRGPGSVRDFRW